MADPARRRPDNVDGEFFVDSSCIDCDTCRMLAPMVFLRSGEQSAVGTQPVSPEERRAALSALIACPTASIGTTSRDSSELREAARAFPSPIAGQKDVFYCGYHSEKSFGAASYFIRRPEGNVLVDSPRFAGPLVKRLEEMGGVDFMFLTHRDDVADHAKFRRHFNCRRILHRDDLGRGTRDVELQLKGPEEYRLAEDLLIIPVPGHTRGHCVLLYGVGSSDRNVLFTGDHLAYSQRRGHPHAFRNACWYSWPEQIKSMRRLAEFDFIHVLPGHGRPVRVETNTDMKAMMARCIAWMESMA